MTDKEPKVHVITDAPLPGRTPKPPQLPGALAVSAGDFTSAPITSYTPHEPHSASTIPEGLVDEQTTQAYAWTTWNGQDGRVEIPEQPEPGSHWEDVDQPTATFPPIAPPTPWFVEYGVNGNDATQPVMPDMLPPDKFDDNANFDGQRRPSAWAVLGGLAAGGIVVGGVWAGANAIFNNEPQGPAPHPTPTTRRAHAPATPPSHPSLQDITPVSTATLEPTGAPASRSNEGNLPSPVDMPSSATYRPPASLQPDTSISTVSTSPADVPAPAPALTPPSLPTEQASVVPPPVDAEPTPLNPQPAPVSPSMQPEYPGPTSTPAPQPSPLATSVETPAPSQSSTTAQSSSSSSSSSSAKSSPSSLAATITPAENTASSPAIPEAQHSGPFYTPQPNLQPNQSASSEATSDHTIGTIASETQSTVEATVAPSDGQPTQGPSSESTASTATGESDHHSEQENNQPGNGSDGQLQSQDNSAQQNPDNKGSDDDQHDDGWFHWPW